MRSAVGVGRQVRRRICMRESFVIPFEVICGNKNGAGLRGLGENEAMLLEAWKSKSLVI